MRRVLAALFVLGVAACATAAVTVPTCPPLVEYTPGEQDSAYRELQTLPEGSMLKRMMNDYGKLRAQCRALTQG
jgi:hypothetical protein